MKKLLFLLALFVCGNVANAQFKVGVNAGFPVGDAADYYNLSAGLDLYYMFGKSKDALLKFGVGSGFLNYFGDDIDGGGSIDDAQFIPIAIAARITFLSTLTFGGDVGYGIGINDGNDGGVYGKAVLGLDLGNTIEVNAFYHLVKIVKGMDFATTGLGVLFVF